MSDAKLRLPVLDSELKVGGYYYVGTIFNGPSFQDAIDPTALKLVKVINLKKYPYLTMVDVLLLDEATTIDVAGHLAYSWFYYEATEQEVALAKEQFRRSENQRIDEAINSF